MATELPLTATASLVSQSSRGAGDSGSQQLKVKLRLCYGGRFEQTPNSSSYKFVGGEYFNESVPYGIRYADFMFKLSEKFKTAVSVKYHAPGEELVPDQLISVQDDADLQELVEDYVAHLQRPGTPCKTFRIKVFVFMAAEEPLTPDEIMEGQHFFSECQLGVMPARLNAVRLLDGRSSFGSTLSSVGTPSTRQQDLSAGDWLAPNSAGQGVEDFEGTAASAAAEGVSSEQELLDRTAASCNRPQRMREQQRRSSSVTDPAAAAAGDAAASGGGDAAAAGGTLQGLFAAAAAADGGGAGGEGGEGDDSAYEEEDDAGMLRQISAEMEEVLQAIDAQQQQDAAAAVASIREVQQEALLDVLQEAAGVMAGRDGYADQEDEYEDEEQEGYDGYDEYEEAEEAAEEEEADAAAAQPEGAQLSSSVWGDEEDDEDASVHIDEASSAGHLQQQQRDQLPENPWQQEQEQHAGGSVDSMVRALPSHISDFGECPLDGEGEDAAAAAVEPTAAAAAGARGAAAGAVAAAAAAVSGQGGEEEGAAPHLPSHISAFGDDLLGQLPGGRALLSGGGAADDGLTDLDSRLSGSQLGCARPRTQDSSFSLDGGAFEGEGGAASAAGGGINAERAGSGDSLTSLPKLQPVHRLAKPDLKIVQRIGEGAFGEVSVAKAPLYGTVAVKWLKSERFNKHFASFGREAALLADLNHPNVLRFYGVVTESAADSSVIGIMTEYIRGGSMSRFLRMNRTLLPLRVRCELALGAANGLAYLHELRIVHFDLKPDNLLLDAPLAVVRAAAGSGVEELPSRRGGASSPAGAGASSQDDGDSSRGGGGGGAAGGAPSTAGGAGGPSSSSSSPGAALQRGGSGAAAAAAAGGGSAAGTVTSSPAGAAGGARGGGSSSTRRNSSGPGRVPGSGSGLMMESSELPVVKVADFGLSKHKLNSSYVSSCRDLRGTLPYMAPELVSDPERVCEKADVWSLGVVMWEMMTRETPFQELAPQQILLGLMCGNLHLDIPEWCEPEWRFLLEACMEPNPNNRPTMRELARQLEAIRDQQLQHEQELEELEAQQQQQQQQQEEEQEREREQSELQSQGSQGMHLQQQSSPANGVQQQPAHSQLLPPLPHHQQAPPPAQQHQDALGALQAPGAAIAGQPHPPQPQPLVVPALDVVQQVPQLPPPLLSPLLHQQPPQLPLQLLSPQQQAPQHLLHSPAALDGAAAAAADPGVFGAVCGHYWPQQAPHAVGVPAASAGALLGVGQLPHPQQL